MTLTPHNFQNLGIAIFFCLTLIVLFGQAMNSLVSEKDLIIKAEFVKTKDELTGLVGNNKEAFKNALLIDTIGFIPVYFALFLLIIWFMAQSEWHWAKYLAIMAAIFAVLTIFFDLSENLRTFDGFKDNPANEPLNIASSAIKKWFCFFITAIILSIAFWKSHYLMIIISAIFILGSAAGMIFLALAKYELIQYSVLAIISAVLITGVSFTFWSDGMAKIFNGK